MRGLAAPTAFPVVRTAPDKRNFTSEAIEKVILEFQRNVKQPELAWLFENCFPNTLDTTVFHTVKDGQPDTYVITGDKPGYTSTRASVSTMDIKRSDPDDTVMVTIYLDSIRNS